MSGSSASVFASSSDSELPSNSERLFHHGVSMSLGLATANENHWEREGTTSVVPQRRRSSKRL